MIISRRAGTADLQILPSSKFFDLKREYVSLLFKALNVLNRINVYYVNTIFEEAGISAPRCIGNAVGNKIVIADGSTSFAALTLAHELGHALGLTHATARGNLPNLMTRTSFPGTILTTTQVEEMHKHMAPDKRASRARQA